MGEHTQLNGAVLAGSENAGKNHLSTGTLGWSDLVNRAEYKVESQSIGISGSGGSKQGFSGKGEPTAATVLGGSNSSGSASSTTFASIGVGDIEIRNTTGQQQDLVSLHRDPTQAVNGLSPIFDKQKELARMQEAQLIGEVGQQATQMVVSHHLAAANEKAKNDPEYANSKEYKALQEKWGVGSDFQRGMQAATAALQGLAGGDLTQAAAGAAAPYLAQMVKQQTDDGIARVMAHALVQGALAAAQNKNAMVGATGAATGELVGMMATELYHKKASQLTEGEKETVSTLATLAAGLAGGLTGDSSASALASAQTGKTVVENNALSDWGSLIPPQTQQDAYLAFQLLSQGKSQDEIAQALILSHQNPTLGDEYKVKPTAKVEGAAGIAIGMFAEGAANEDSFSINGGFTPTFGLRGSATIGLDFGPYLPGFIPTNNDSSFDMGLGWVSLGIASGKDGVGFSVGVGPSIGWGGVSKEIKSVDVEGNGKIGKEIYKYDF